MKKADASYVLDCIETEGFDYCFREWSSFGEIKDAKFHELRNAYEIAAGDLEDYLKQESGEE